MKRLFLFLILIVSSCSSASKIYERTEMHMGTVIILKCGCREEKLANGAFDAAFSEIARIESVMSLYDTTSELSKLNKTGKSTNLELVDVIRKAVEVSELTEGAFDITVGSLLKNYDFANKKLLDKRILETKLPFVNYKDIEFDSIGVKIPQGVRLDLGGIAKGYAIDRAIGVLSSFGIKNGLVNAGGDVRMIGKKEWKIGLKHPRNDQILKTFRFKNISVATSGDYERYFVKEGVIYHHIINPKTGSSARECMSVTVISKEAIDADAFATGVFVLGHEKGMQLLEQLDGIEGIIIYEENGTLTIKESKGMKQYYEVYPQ